MRSNPQKQASRIVAQKVKGEISASKPLATPQDVADVVDPLIGKRAYEHFIVLYLDTKHRVIAYDEFTEGSMAQVAISLSGVLRDALLTGAAGVITVHQHPSGSATPSEADMDIWKGLNEGLKTVGLTGLDHLVIARTEGGALTWYSYADRGGK